jgi:hypothetical protein
VAQGTGISPDQEAQTGLSQKMSPLYLGLVHYPVLNKHGETILTSVTNLDIHDIARSATAYGVKRYFVITPDASQTEHIMKVIGFWQSEAGQSYNSDRSKALAVIQITDSITTSINQITTLEGMQPIVISTTARFLEKQVTFDKVRSFQNGNRPLFLLFGTGYGLSDAVLMDSDYVLQPLEGAEGYNHLSVRSAVAIVLDRITSAVYKGRN